ncbi:MAG: trypsin-like peptidase domain-containing protein, partial [bacterium]
MSTYHRVAQVSVVAMLIGCTREPQSSAAQSTQSTPPGSSGVVAAANDQVSQSRQNAITAAVARVSPSVVTVQTEAVDQTPQDPFDMFFGGSRPRSQAGLGTGFVVRKDGVIITNAHVVANASKVSVMMRDGTVFPARVLGQDETNDLAVVKIDAKGDLPEVKLGNSYNLVIGEWAIAIGNPFGFYLG